MEDDLLNEGYAEGKDANQTLKRMLLYRKLYFNFKRYY